MKKVICIGSAGKDIFFPTDEGVIMDTPEDIMSQKKIAFEMGAKYHIENRLESLGGCAANVACGLKRLGVNSLCYCAIGDDMVGDWVKKELEKESVNLSLMMIINGSKTDLSAIIVDSRSGDRTIFSNKKAATYFIVDPKKIEAADYILIGDIGGDWQESLENILLVAEDRKLKLVFNPREKSIHDNVKKILKVIEKTHILIINKDEAIEILLGHNEQAVADDLNDERYLVKAIKELGPEMVAITDGKNGAWAFDGDELIFAKAKGVKPVDTTGAGDAFTSGFLSAQVKGSNLVESMKWAIANSAHSVQYYGGIEGLLREEEIMDHVLDVEIEK